MIFFECNYAKFTCKRPPTFNVATILQEGKGLCCVFLAIGPIIMSLTVV